MTRATEDTLDGLHGLVADTLKAELNAAALRMPCEHCNQRPGIPPALLAQAIKFLSENGIDAPAAKSGKLNDLRKSLPRFDDEEGSPDNVIHLTRS